MNLGMELFSCERRYHMKKIKIKTKRAKSISYGSKRSRKDIKYIVIHYTGNSGDTASGNANYFADSNTRQAGAHFFVDKKGEVYKSINMNLTAWAVGGDQRSGKKGEATYYGKCTNSNSVSIELCDCNNNTNDIQKEATRQLIQYIRKYCPNAKTIIRHFDVNGKICPRPFVDSSLKWTKFKEYISTK